MPSLNEIIHWFFVTTFWTSRWISFDFQSSYSAIILATAWAVTKTPGPYRNERGEAHNYTSNGHWGTKNCMLGISIQIWWKHSKSLLTLQQKLGLKCPFFPTSCASTIHAQGFTTPTSFLAQSRAQTQLARYVSWLIWCKADNWLLGRSARIQLSSLVLWTLLLQTLLVMDLPSYNVSV